MPLKEPENNKFYGTEYIIDDLEQLYPFIGVKLKRVEYCVIYKDSIFTKEIKEIMKYSEKNSEFNIYRIENTLKALELVKRKKYNKIILISSIENNLEGLKFIDEARKIINNDVIALFISNNIEHLKFIKKYKNVLFTNQAKFCEEYLKCFSEKNTKDIKKKILILKNSIEEHYGIDKFTFNEDFLQFPLYKNTGQYKDLIIEEMNNGESCKLFDEKISLKPQNINSKVIMKKIDNTYYEKNEKNIKFNLSEIVYKPGHKLELDKINKYFIQISIALFILKLNNSQITKLDLKDIFLDKDDNILIDLTNENSYENEFTKKENQKNIDTLYLGFILYELLYKKKFDMNKLGTIKENLESINLSNTNITNMKYILRNLLFYNDKRYSLHQLLSCEIFLELFEDNIYKEISKGNIKCKLIYINYYLYRFKKIFY